MRKPSRLVRLSSLKSIDSPMKLRLRDVFSVKRELSSAGPLKELRL